MKVWMIRAGESSRLIEEFKRLNVVGVGWNETGDLTNCKTSEEVKLLVQAAYSDLSKGSRVSSAGQVARFRFEIRANEDYAITYDGERRVYHLGKIVGEYCWKCVECEYYHQRRVEWLREIPRDNFSTSTKYTLGAIMSLFLLNEDAAAEVLKADVVERPVEEPDQPEAAIETEIRSLRENVKSNARELIKDKLTKLSWDSMQDLVAGLLRAMGYKTFVSPTGPDQGRDVIASKDGLGLEDPRIVVEVKHRPGSAMGAMDIRSFTGGLRSGHKGVYVSTGGFTREAKYEAERSSIPVTIVNLDLLVDLLIQYYDQFDSDARSLLPLTKIYWPE